VINRPLDFLDGLRGKEVEVTLKEGDMVVGFLVAFDIHINLVLRQKELKKEIFVRGDTIVFVEGRESEVSKKK